VLEPYFLGQRHDESLARFLEKYSKRLPPPSLLTPTEIKAPVDTLGLREQTLVLLDASTGLETK